MELPFTREAFLEVFARYNQALWPVALALWVGSVGLAAVSLGARRPPDRALCGLLALQWLWSGAAYHAALFSRINPAAWLFAAGFLLEAGLIVRVGIAQRRLHFSTGRSPRHVVAGALVVYALAYPVLNLALGHVWPHTPTFGVPCPTVILTTGWLLVATGPIWTVSIVPLLWCVVGGSAALLLDVRADLVLPVAGAALLVHAAGALSRRHAGRSSHQA